MTDSSEDNSHNRRIVDRETFAQFLKFLSPDHNTAEHHYTLLHAKLVGFFSMKGISDPWSAADVTIDRAAVKIVAGTPVPDVDKYCFGIARYVAKESLRRDLRESSVILSAMEKTADSSDEQVERINSLLKPCFEELEAAEQQLLLAYCQILHGRARAEHRARLAEKMNTTVLALRMRVTRLRTKLTDCVKQRLNNR